jgi:hypothetical protein
LQCQFRVEGLPLFCYAAVTVPVQTQRLPLRNASASAGVGPTLEHVLAGNPTLETTE